MFPVNLDFSHERILVSLSHLGHGQDALRDRAIQDEMAILEDDLLLLSPLHDFSMNDALA